MRFDCHFHRLTLILAFDIEVSLRRLYIGADAARSTVESVNLQVCLASETAKSLIDGCLLLRNHRSRNLTKVSYFGTETTLSSFGRVNRRLIAVHIVF